MQLLPPASTAEVERTFMDLGHPVSSDVLDLYSVIGGFLGGDSDRLWSFWSLDEIRFQNQDQKLRRKRPFVMFADWLISSHVYCFRYESPDASSVFISHDGWSLEAEPIACGVATFLEMLLDHPNEVQVWDL